MTKHNLIILVENEQKYVASSLHNGFYLFVIYGHANDLVVIWVVCLGMKWQCLGMCRLACPSRCHRGSGIVFELTWWWMCEVL